MQLTTIYIVQLLLIGGALSHSWIACTDYLQENGDYWSSSYCRAYARDGHSYTPKDSFGQDTGYNYNNVPDNKPCKTDRDDSNAYNTEYPMAVYYPGQKIVIAHPTKNHVAETCTNKYIPDSGSFVYRSEANPVTDPTLTTFKQNQVADLGISPFGYEMQDINITTYPKYGYQNAPKFCENMDKALATYAFYIPTNLQSGRYTFLWSWSFNSVGSSDTYTSCWEADVVSTKADRDNVLTTRGQSTSDPEVLHGKSLAVVPDGVTTQSAAPTTAASTTAASLPASTEGSTNAPTAAPTQAPCGDCVPSTLTCVDNCLKSCYP